MDSETVLVGKYKCISNVCNVFTDKTQIAKDNIQFSKGPF